MDRTFVRTSLGLDHVLGERREARLVTQGHADVGQTPHQESLGTTDLGHAASQCRQVEAPVRPATGLPDVFVIAAIHAQIMEYILRMPQPFTAPYAVNVTAIRRTRDRLAPGMGVAGALDDVAQVAATGPHERGSVL